MPFLIFLRNTFLSDAIFSSLLFFFLFLGIILATILSCKRFINNLKFLIQMKKSIFLVLFLIGTSGLFAQNFSGSGDQKLQAGFNFYGHGTGIKATYDYGLGDQFSIGVGGVFYNSGDYNAKFFVFGRADYHFAEPINLPEQWDTYLGVELGLVGDGEFGLGGHLGARYALSDTFSIFVEAGNNGAVGIALNL